LAYAFAPGEKNITRALRRIARQRVDASLGLFERGAMDEARRIHELRKNIKKLRGLIRLVRPVFADYAAENRALGEAGRAIGHLRDADVRAAGLADLADRARLPKAERDALLAAAARDSDRPTAAEAEAALVAHLDALRLLRHRIDGWKVDAKGFAALEPGLERVLKRGARAMVAARRDPEGEPFHDWRKRVKDHWYHARLLTPIWPGMMTARATAAGDLGEMLGDARDLDLLAEALAPMADAGTPGAGKLVKRARRERADLTLRADRLGRLLYAEPAPALTARWGAWWRISGA